MAQNSDQLTRYQRQLLQEIEQIASIVKLDYQEASAYEPDARTPVLELMRRKLVICEVVTRYTLVDEYLNVRLCHFFFGRKRSFIRLWKTKRFKLFNHHVLEELPLMAKLRFAKSIAPIPKSVAADIERLNSLRNGLAHAFFPENLRKSRPEWKGKKIFTLEGLQLFLDDMAKIAAYFVRLSPEELDVL
ncbi:MAG TPA: hypothetical protein VFB15_05525 [Candidatus Binataceae bacterium]|jgi:hypothetical protein|nr:hypothetical protein [Candidatus Binataceae bacterium]